MSTAEGSCDKLERAITMELELLESQLFPLLIVWKYQNKAEKKMRQHRGLPIVHLLICFKSLSCFCFSAASSFSLHLLFIL